MENSSEELWKIRLANQKYPLIGTVETGNGNGYHDRQSFDIPYHLVTREDESRHYSWLFSVYFRDLSNYLNPQYSKDNGAAFQNEISLGNCSENFRNTFFKYISPSHSWGRDGILDILGQWSNDLIHRGRIILEFVGWYDNESKDFYAYELKQINSSNCIIKKNCVLFTSPVEEEGQKLRNLTVEIPKKKCIIIEWPTELGGYSTYEDTVNSILKIGNKLSPIEESIHAKPGETLEKMKEWDMKFNSLTSRWGTTSSIENTTEFYKQYNFFVLKETLIYCTHALIDGLKQLIAILNEKLAEESTLTFEYKETNIEKVQEMKNKWLEGNLSFKESSKVLTFH